MSDQLHLDHSMFYLFAININEKIIFISAFIRFICHLEKLQKKRQKKETTSKIKNLLIIKRLSPFIFVF